MGVTLFLSIESYACRGVQAQMNLSERDPNFALSQGFAGQRSPSFTFISGSADSFNLIEDTEA